jgi:hypothetical protein
MTALDLLCVVGGVTIILLVIGGLVLQEARQYRRMNASGDIYERLARGEAVRFRRTDEGYLLERTEEK